MSQTECVFLVTSLITVVKCQIGPNIVGGSFTSISRFPHAAFLSIMCELNHDDEYSCICGSSIVNQRVVLTAGHCLDMCGDSSYVAINIGSEHKENGFATTAYSFLIHSDYNQQTNKNDIALVKTKHRLVLNAKISRVALMPRPPYGEKAKVTGWGVTDEQKQTLPDRLRFIEQTVWNNDDCMKLFGRMLPGTFCACSKKSSKEFASQGDSGSALVVRGYIQIGLVSFKNPKKSKNVVIYTDVGYFYDWIREGVKLIYCE